MAAADTANPVQKDWRKKESFVSALVQVLIVGVVLAAAVAFYVQQGITRKAVADKLKEAKETALRGNPKELRAALATLDEIFLLDDGAGDALAVAATLHTELWMNHKVAESEAKAKEFLARAVSADSKSGERYAAEGLHKLAAGDAKGADTYVDGLLQQGANSARLLHVAGLSNQAKGALKVSAEFYRRAMEREWKDPRFSYAYAEQALEEGNFMQAAESVDRTLKTNGEHLQSVLLGGLMGFYQGSPGTMAADAFKAVTERPETELSPALQARAKALQAELALAAGNADEALAAAEAGIALNGADAYASFAKARALAAKKDPAAAQAFQQTVSKKPTAPLFYFTGASALIANGDTAGAKSLLDTYESTFKDVRLEVLGGETEIALDRDDRYWLARGDLLRTAGDLDGAMAAYEKAIAAKSLNQARAHYAKGALLMEKKDFAKAKEVLALVTPEDGTGQVPEAYKAMGDLFFQEKDWGTGASHYGFALGRFRSTGMNMDGLNALREEVAEKLRAGGQRDTAKLWLEESKGLLQ